MRTKTTLSRREYAAEELLRREEQTAREGHVEVVAKMAAAQGRFDCALTDDEVIALRRLGLVCCAHGGAWRVEDRRTQIRLTGKNNPFSALQWAPEGVVVK